MKRNLIFAAIAAVAFAGCTENADPEQGVQTGSEVEFTLDFAMFDSGDMTRASADAVYKEFYDNQIKTKKLTPKSYSLTISDKSTKKTVAEFMGKWGENNMVKLPAGTYHITGASSDDYSSAYLKFDEDIQITSSTTSITLTANYDCYLLLFDATGKTEMDYHAAFSNTKDGFVSKVDNTYYFFGNNVYSDATIIWTNSSNLKTTLYIGQMAFQTGKYYVYSDHDGSFNISPMVSGS